MKQKSKKRHWNYIISVILLIAPALLFYLTFIIYPVGKSVVMSFFQVNLTNAAEQMKFVGLANFQAVFQDAVFLKAAKNTLTWALSAPFLEIPIALLLALALRKKTALSRFLRVVWFVPVLLPAVVIGIIWSWIYNFDWGFLNSMLRAVGLDSLAQAWLGTPATALPALIAVTTWTWIGFNMVILLAAISSIPDDILEAATIDGANKAKQLFHIIIPMIRPVLINLLILCVVGKMKVYDLIWVTTQGGPMWSTETVATYTVKRAFYWGTFEKGFPSAMATIWFLLIITLALTLTKLLQRKDKLEY